MGYFWLAARYILLLARTQGYVCAVGSIAGGLVVKLPILLVLGAFASPTVQVVIAIIMPVATALLFETACAMARDRADRAEEERAEHAPLAAAGIDEVCVRTVFGVPAVPRTRKHTSAAERRTMFVLLAIAAIPILVVRALDDGGGIYLFAALVYALTMLLEYTMSTLYHAIAVDRAKRVFKVLDHSCIYLFIAGSYTPFCLISLADSGGVWLCAFVWLVALAGVACEAFWVFRPRWVSAVLYLLMGWCVVWFLPALIEAIPGPGLWLLVGGGICYSIGCIFYVLKKVPYMHSLFHLWVLAGSVLQFLAISLYVM